MDDWDYFIYPEDFPLERQPPPQILSKKKAITAKEFVPEQNHFGGFVFAGGTMAFTAGYWALGFLKPDVIAYLGCDMLYPKETQDQNHFYGNGTSDPLRQDITFQSLEAKSVRLMAIAQMNQCEVVNLSELPESRLMFRRASLSQLLSHSTTNLLSGLTPRLDEKLVKKALDKEETFSYMAPSGRYWEVLNEFNPIKLREIDSLWLESLVE